MMTKTEVQNLYKAIKAEANTRSERGDWVVYTAVLKGQLLALESVLQGEIVV